MGDLEAKTPVFVESTFGYHPEIIEVLTLDRYPDRGQFQMGSLTGAVASKKVTEAYKGFLRMVGNHP